MKHGEHKHGGYHKKSDNRDKHAVLYSALGNDGVLPAERIQRLARVEFSVRTLDEVYAFALFADRIGVRTVMRNAHLAQKVDALLLNLDFMFEDVVLARFARKLAEA